MDDQGEAENPKDFFSWDIEKIMDAGQPLDASKLAEIDLEAFFDYVKIITPPDSSELPDRYKSP